MNIWRYQKKWHHSKEIMTGDKLLRFISAPVFTCFTCRGTICICLQAPTCSGKTFWPFISTLSCLHKVSGDKWGMHDFAVQPSCTFIWAFCRTITCLQSSNMLQCPARWWNILNALTVGYCSSAYGLEALHWEHMNWLRHVKHCWSRIKWLLRPCPFHLCRSSCFSREKHTAWFFDSVFLEWMKILLNYTY